MPTQWSKWSKLASISDGAEKYQGKYYDFLVVDMVVAS